jgi:hypothetical protein
MTELAFCLIIISVFVLAFCLFHAAGVCIMKLWNQRTGKREYRIVQRVL